MSPSGKVEGADVPHDYVPGKGYVPRVPSVSEQLQEELEPLPAEKESEE